MTDAPPNPQPASQPVPPTALPVLNDERQMAFVVYVLYLASFAPVLGWIAAVVGLVLAYVERDRAPDWLKSHFTFQIRSFWIGLLYFFGSCILLVALVGIPLLLATCIWFVVRCALGISRLLRGEAYPNPQTWTF